MSIVHVNRLPGVLFGLAFGDAWGYRYEFTPVGNIPDQPPFPRPAIVSDDTQLALAVWDAMVATIVRPPEPRSVLRYLVHHYQAWQTHPDNDRAPGSGMHAALDALQHWGLDRWEDASQVRGAPSSAVTRAAWVGASPFAPRVAVGPLAALAAGVTFGSPEATACAAATAELVAALIRDETVPGKCGTWLADYAADQMGTQYNHPVLSNLYARISPDPWQYQQDGAAAVLHAAFNAIECVGHLADDPFGQDPCRYTGMGWHAAEALSTAVACIDLLPTNPVQAMRRAVRTDGDSDAIAALVGAFGGAAFGNVWPLSWQTSLEPRYYQALVLRARHALTGRNVPAPMFAATDVPS